MAALTNPISPSSLRKPVGSPDENDYKEFTVRIRSGPSQGSYSSLAPYLFIRTLSGLRKYQLLEERSAQSIAGYPASELTNDFSTSCLYNAHALAVVFSGIERAQFIFRRVQHHISFMFPIATETDPFFYKVQLDGLLAGQIIAELEDADLTPEKAHLIAKRYWRKWSEQNKENMQQFLAQTDAGNLENPEVLRSCLDKYFVGNTFPFNKETIDLMCLKFEQNSKELSDDVSFIYYLNFQKRPEKVYHVLIVEQFFVPNQPEGMFRIYQTWVNKITLPEYFRKRGYGNGVEGCLTLAEMKEFCANLSLLFNRGPTAAEMNKLHTLCFGVPKPAIFNPLIYVPLLRMWRGISFRFYCDKIHPSQCEQHFSEFMSNTDCNKAAQPRRSGDAHDV